MLCFKRNSVGSTHSAPLRACPELAPKGLVEGICFLLKDTADCKKLSGCLQSRPLDKVSQAVNCQADGVHIISKIIVEAEQLR